MYMWGFSGLVIVLYLIGVIACPPQNEAISYAQAELSLVWLGWYSLTLSSMTYTIVSEIDCMHADCYARSKSLTTLATW